ncbi:hypothetical protein EON64_13795 [archaeon]|nr:MAG: hypothetical protein EON64_13795 [archaeon]
MLRLLIRERGGERGLGISIGGGYGGGVAGLGQGTRGTRGRSNRGTSTRCPGLARLQGLRVEHREEVVWTRQNR